MGQIVTREKTTRDAPKKVRQIAAPSLREARCGCVRQYPADTIVKWCDAHRATRSMSGNDHRRK